MYDIQAITVLGVPFLVILMHHNVQLKFDFYSLFFVATKALGEEICK
jgi:hypothetical protein